MRKEQIEEMARIIHGTPFSDMHRAVALYNAGFRKQSEGEWEKYPDEHEICATEFVCSVCKESFCSSEMTDKELLAMLKYCPNCGSKMKGGAE